MTMKIGDLVKSIEQWNRPNVRFGIVIELHQTWPLNETEILVWWIETGDFIWVQESNLKVINEDR